MALVSEIFCRSGASAVPLVVGRTVPVDTCSMPRAGLLCNSHFRIYVRRLPLKIQKILWPLALAAVGSMMSVAFAQAPPAAQAGRGGQGMAQLRSP